MSWVTPPWTPPDFRWSSALWPGTGSNLKERRYYIYIIYIFVYPSQHLVTARWWRAGREGVASQPSTAPRHARHTRRHAARAGAGRWRHTQHHTWGRGEVTLHWTLLQQADLGRQVEAAGVHGGDHLLLCCVWGLGSSSTQEEHRRWHVLGEESKGTLSHSSILCI